MDAQDAIAALLVHDAACLTTMRLAASSWRAAVDRQLLSLTVRLQHQTNPSYEPALAASLWFGCRGSRLSTAGEKHMPALTSWLRRCTSLREVIVSTHSLSSMMPAGFYRALLDGVAAAPCCTELHFEGCRISLRTIALWAETLPAGRRTVHTYGVVLSGYEFEAEDEHSHAVRCMLQGNAVKVHDVESGPEVRNSLQADMQEHRAEDDVWWGLQLLGPDITDLTIHGDDTPITLWPQFICHPIKLSSYGAWTAAQAQLISSRLNFLYIRLEGAALHELAALRAAPQLTVLALEPAVPVWLASIAINALQHMPELLCLNLENIPEPGSYMMHSAIFMLNISRLLVDVRKDVSWQQMEMVLVGMIMVREWTVVFVGGAPLQLDAQLSRWMEEQPEFVCHSASFETCSVMPLLADACQRKGARCSI